MRQRRNDITQEVHPEVIYGHPQVIYGASEVYAQLGLAPDGRALSLWESRNTAFKLRLTSFGECGALGKSGSNAIIRLSPPMRDHGRHP